MEIVECKRNQKQSTRGTYDSDSFLLLSPNDLMEGEEGKNESKCTGCTKQATQLELLMQNPPPSFLWLTFLRLRVGQMAVTLKTSLGDIKIELFCELAPKTCKNFLALAAAGKYDGTVFHRCIKKFILQGGAPAGSGGKGGESIYGKFFEDEVNEALKHDRRGTLSMANRGPNKNGSQFFFAFDKLPHLNNVNTVFGHIIHGIEVLDLAEKVETDTNDRPVHDIELLGVKIHANPFAESEG
jgi:peptidyl-prolyl cis-trans isomerase-like 3